MAIVMGEELRPEERALLEARAGAGSDDAAQILAIHDHNDVPAMIRLLAKTQEFSMDADQIEAFLAEFGGNDD